MIDSHKLQSVDNAIENLGVILAFSMSQAFGQLEKSAAGKPIGQPPGDAEVLAAIRTARTQSVLDAARWAQLHAAIDDALADRALAIVAAHPCGLAPFATKLADAELAPYVRLMQANDARFKGLFAALMEWATALDAAAGEDQKPPASEPS
jgi:hypothetical protein